MYRIWYSTESFADYIIDNTVLKTKTDISKNILYESDANKPNNFHKIPDHIKKILYLDACDLIVEKDNEPVFSIEVTTEAGTGHNAFQRFARIAASVENQVPAFYIYPEAAIITRRNAAPCWDKINPLIFRALEGVMSIYQIPALLYYFPSDIKDYLYNPEDSPNLAHKGLQFDQDIINYSGCPSSQSDSMQNLFNAINEIITKTEELGVRPARKTLLSNMVLRTQRNFMQSEFSKKSNDRSEDQMSPLTSVVKIETKYLLNYLSLYENCGYNIGELLKLRPYTIVYHINAKFRGDPYPGALAAIDYLKCREGKTFEERCCNLVLVFGKFKVDDVNKTLIVTDDKASSSGKGSTIESFFKDVKNCSRHNLLYKDYIELEHKDIPRYYMQVRYGSTYSKAKHIRVFSYFADAILFPDGALWRDA